MTTRAMRFLEASGRPVDLAFARWSRGEGAAGAVLEALDAYQRPDGGYGGGLEPDAQLGDASALATTVALQHMAALGVGAEEPRLGRAMSYLTETWEPRLRSWPLVPPQIDDAPHAPWWSRGEDFEAKWRSFQGNPKPEIAGYLLRWPTLAPAGLAGLAEETIAWLEGWEGEVEQHDLLCFVRLLETPQLEGGLRARLQARLEAAVEAQVGRSAEAWSRYGLQPLDLAERPESPLAAQVKPWIEENLRWVLAQQEEDGAWSPAWSWFGLYDEAWPTARAAWRSALTCRNLRRLAAWGVEGA